MDTPRARSPCPLPPLSSKPTAPLPPLSAGASPSHDFSFLFATPSANSSPLGGLPMSRAPIGRVVSDLSHNNSFSTSSSKASRHQTTSYGTGSKDNRGQAKNRTSAFFSGLGGGAWSRKEISSSVDKAGGNKQKLVAEEKRKDKAKRATTDLGQWVKKYMTAVVDHLRSSLYRGQAAGRDQRRRRPHSFSGHGPMKERERRGQQLSSAPASLRVSPANSGHLSVGRSVKMSASSSEESTMEELQSAIEAAIAHCKNSISRARADE